MRATVRGRGALGSADFFLEAFISLPHSRTRGGLPGPGVAKVLFDFDHPETGARCIPALALPAATSTLQRLLHRFHRQDRVPERNAVPDGNVHQPVVCVVADDIVVAGLAADDAAERDGAKIVRSRSRKFL